MIRPVFVTSAIPSSLLHKNFGDDKKAWIAARSVGFNVPPQNLNINPGVLLPENLVSLPRTDLLREARSFHAQRTWRSAGTVLFEDGVPGDGTMSGLCCSGLGEIGWMISEACGVPLGKACLGYLGLGKRNVCDLN
eukprot:115758-Ditylum_brightwellii.AAC.1